MATKVTHTPHVLKMLLALVTKEEQKKNEKKEHRRGITLHSMESGAKMPANDIRFVVLSH